MKSPTKRFFWLATLLLIAAIPSVHAEIIGVTQVGSVPSAGMSANMKRGSKFTLTESATATLLCAYVDGNGGVSGSQQFRLALYRDSNGVPGAKVTESVPYTVQSGDATSLRCQDIPFTPLTPGTYWVVIHSGGAAGVARYFYDPSSNNWYGNADTYADGASSLFGAGSAGSGVMSVALVYIPSRSLSVAGRTTVGTVPSKGLFADYKRGSSFTIPTPARLSSLNAYLAGTGGGTGTQQMVRLALYTDANGVPGTKVIQSDERAILPYWAGHWEQFDMPAMVIPAGKYWIVIHSGASTGIAVDFADGTGNWYGNADTYSDGASTSFGTPIAGNGTISAYMAYVPGPFRSITIGLGPGASGVPSAGMTANYSRGSYFWFGADRPALDTLSAYLDGFGGASGSQTLRMAVYADNNGVPGSLFTSSGTVTVPAGMAAQWMQFPLRQLPIPPGGYWLVLQSGGANGVARNYGSPTWSSWWGAADSFSDGPSDPFGAQSGIVGPGTVNLLLSGTITLPTTR